MPNSPITDRATADLSLPDTPDSLPLDLSTTSIDIPGPRSTFRGYQLKTPNVLNHNRGRAEACVFHLQGSMCPSSTSCCWYLPKRQNDISSFQPTSNELAPSNVQNISKNDNTVLQDGCIEVLMCVLTVSADLSWYDCFTRFD